ncbi:hypothetical protein AAG570_000195 [Ranatra chinensis]|uniref:Uncharacterized protein n=1 Tax=Ranatra chinensis TaxID=642074 RepID=A0ABD0ZDA5_9HEMI
MLSKVMGDCLGGVGGCEIQEVIEEKSLSTNMAFRSMSNELDRDGIAVMVVYPGLFASRVGGRKVKRTAEKSAKRVFRLMLKLDKRANGRFYGPKGRQLFW